MVAFPEWLRHIDQLRDSCQVGGVPVWDFCFVLFSPSWHCWSQSWGRVGVAVGEGTLALAQRQAAHLIAKTLQLDAQGVLHERNGHAWRLASVVLFSSHLQLHMSCWIQPTNAWDRHWGQRRISFWEGERFAFKDSKRVGHIEASLAVYANAFFPKDFCCIEVDWRGKKGRQLLGHIWPPTPGHCWAREHFLPAKLRNCHQKVELCLEDWGGGNQHQDYDILAHQLQHCVHAYW